MFNFRLLGLFLIAFSTQTIAVEFTWDDPESGTGLHISAKGIDQKNETWTVRETRMNDTSFYQDILGNPEVMKTMGDGDTLPPEKIVNYVTTWTERFANGRPFGRMTIEQNNEAIGCVQLGQNEKRPGVGEVSRAFKPSVQGKGLGKAALGFIVEDWAPAIRKIALNQDINAPISAVEKFKCFGGEALQLIYTTARPSNVASWKCYKPFSFHPSEPTDKTQTISCEGWEQSQHGSLEDYIVSKHFSQTATDRLKVDVLYNMLDENGEQRTLSYADKYGSPRYHFERKVE